MKNASLNTETDRDTPRLGTPEILPTMLPSETTKKDSGSRGSSPRPAPQAQVSSSENQTQMPPHGQLPSSESIQSAPAYLMPQAGLGLLAGDTFPQRSPFHGEYAHAPLLDAGSYARVQPPPRSSSASPLPRPTAPLMFPAYDPQYPGYQYGPVGQAYSQGPYSGSRTGSYFPTQQQNRNYPELGPSPATYGGGAEAYSAQYSSGYPPQYEVNARGYGYGRGRGARNRDRHSPPRSYAVNPGKPIYKDPNRKFGPVGANLFIFHVPNDMTNQHLYELFAPYGCVLCASISTERDTGRGRGFAFINYESAVSAANAIHYLDGFEVSGQRS